MKRLFDSDLMVVLAACLLGLTIVFSLQRAADHNPKAVRHGDLVFIQPWVKISSPSARSAAGYVQIHNKGDADRLLEVRTNLALRNELHTMIDENGIMKMRALENGIEIPKHAMVRLQPGGKHIMLMGLYTTQTEAVNLTLVFEHAGSVDLYAPINPKDMQGQKQKARAHQH